MPLNPELSKFIGQPYIHHSPQFGVEASAGDCRFWLHQFYKSRLGITLPPGLWSQEIFHDQQIFQIVAPAGPFYEADIFMFSPNHGSPLDPRQLHLAYFTGEADSGGQPLLLHASHYNQQVAVWSLTDFLSGDRYGKLERVKRLKPGFWEPLVKPLITCTADRQIK
ncbi:hypothetical protein L6272_03900 [Microgenomates group bacterium]|nr:hypothetical protein [Microgenomates group bacterium]